MILACTTLDVAAYSFSSTACISYCIPDNIDVCVLYMYHIDNRYSRYTSSSMAKLSIATLCHNNQVRMIHLYITVINNDVLYEEGRRGCGWKSIYSPCTIYILP